MYVRVYVYIYTHIHTYIHTYIHTHIFIYTAFLLAAGSGVVGTAEALSQAGADVVAVGECGRNAADRCAGSSFTMQRWGYV